MLKRAIKFMIFLFMVAFGVYLNMAILYLVPWPLTNINMLSVITVSWLYFRPSSVIIWYTVFAYYCVDLITLSPFGILLLSATISSIVLYWFFQYVFTRHSVISVFLLSLLNIAILRIGYAAFYVIYGLFVEVQPSFTSILFSTGTEMLMTALTSAIVYFVFIKQKTSPAKLLSYVKE